MGIYIYTLRAKTHDIPGLGPVREYKYLYKPLQTSFLEPSEKRYENLMERHMQQADEKYGKDTKLAVCIFKNIKTDGTGWHAVYGLKPGQTSHSGFWYDCDVIGPVVAYIRWANKKWEVSATKPEGVR